MAVLIAEALGDGVGVGQGGTLRRCVVRGGPARTQGAASETGEKSLTSKTSGRICSEKAKSALMMILGDHL